MAIRDLRWWDPWANRILDGKRRSKEFHSTFKIGSDTQRANELSVKKDQTLRFVFLCGTLNITHNCSKTFLTVQCHKIYSWWEISQGVLKRFNRNWLTFCNAIPWIICRDYRYPIIDSIKFDGMCGNPINVFGEALLDYGRLFVNKSIRLFQLLKKAFWSGFIRAVV